MRSYQKFLFYYSLIITTILLVACFTFAPQPQNFFALALFAPIPLYFWLKISLEGENSPYRWSLKMLSILFLTGILGIFAFWLAGKTSDKSPTINPPEIVSLPTETVLGAKDREDLKNILEEIKTDLSQIKAEQRATREILGISGMTKDITDIINNVLETATGAALSVP